jgi:glycosyltransferase involved in cell wall biosynthesis
MGRVIIIHYHLNPGGVTRIIESQVRALKTIFPANKLLILAGKKADPEYFNPAGTEILVNENLYYLAAETDIPAAYRSLKNFFADLLEPSDILHVHNLNLGKNPVLTYVIAELAGKGCRVINHAHDFAEDRPENLQLLKKVFSVLSAKDTMEILYPPCKSYLHVSINSGDLERLKVSTADRQRCFLLPNPVAFPETFAGIDKSTLKRKICTELKIPESRKMITYPVRVIRRKNIGEFILLSFLFRNKAAWLVTQAPRNPGEILSYEAWKKFCHEENISVFFEAGNRVKIEELIIASDFCISTSIKEGFGMAFMEPWLLNTPVAGRNLPSVTADLTKCGIILPRLYNSLNITAGDSATDFALMNETSQMNYIHDLKSDEKEKEFMEYNPFLQNLLNSVDQSTINHNRNIILKEFSLENYARRLHSLYQELAG